MASSPHGTSVPLHQRIADELEASIKSGEWKPGDRIPYEQELTAHYDCSRMTVNKAISALVARGMIVRRRRAGSFVASPALELAVLQIEDISDEVRRAGHRYSFTVLARDIGRLDRDEAARLGEKAGEEVLHLTCLHSVNGMPHALESRAILLRAVPLARDEPFTDKSPGAWLLEQVPWSKARHVIRAVSPDAATSKTLKIGKGTACLRLTRQTWQEGLTVTYVEMVYAGERYQFAGVFEP